MRLQWTPWALPGLAVLVCGLFLAWFIYRFRPDRAQNRRLALQLLLEAPVVAILSGGIWIVNDADTVRFLVLAANVLVWPKLWTYYSFLATLDTPLARPLQSRRRLNGLLAVTLLAATTVLVWPQWYGGEIAYWPAVDGLHMAPGTAFVPIFWMWGLMWLVGLSFSISALRHAKTALRREQARAFLIAFGTRDVTFLWVVAFLTLVPPTYAHFHWVFLVFAAIWLTYFPLVAYGILKHQLFDIDLRLKQTVKRSTILGSFAGAFFIGGEALEQIVPVDGFFLGLLAAGAVAAAFRPLQRLAEAVAEGAMPEVNTSATYLTERRHEVYRDAIEGAFEDGRISDRERVILQKVQESLGVESEAASRIEAEVKAVLSGATAASAAAATRQPAPR